MKYFIFLILVIQANSQEILKNWEFVSKYKYDQRFNTYKNNYKVFNNDLIQIGNLDNGLVIKSKDEELNLSKLFPHIDIKSFVAFDIDENFIVVKDFDFIYIFEHTLLDNIKFLNSIPSNLYLTNLKIWNNKVYLYDVHFSEDNCEQPSQTLFLELDLSTYQIRNIPFDNIQGIDLANFDPRKLIDFNKGIISVSDLTAYNINFYNATTGLLVDSITMENDFWKPNQELSSYYDCGPNMASYLYSMQYIFNKISAIWRSEFINDSLFMVTYTFPILKDGKESLKYKYDIYKKINEKWTIHRTDLDDYSKSENDYFAPQTINIYHTYRIIEGNLCKIVAYPKSLIKFDGSTTIQKFEKELEEFYYDNDLEYTLLVYKIKT